MGFVRFDAEGAVDAVLGHAARDGIEACAAAAGKNDAFHGFLLKY